MGIRLQRVAFFSTPARQPCAGRRTLSLSGPAARGHSRAVETLSHFLLIAAFASVFQERRNLTIAAFLVAVGVTAFTLWLHISESLPLNF